MFRKLVTNLPYQPALLGQVGFYLRRIHQEEALRRLGLILTALVVVVQIFAIISPSKPSLATSAADIVYGANSRQDVLQAYRNNRDKLGRTDIQAIFSHYGIGLDQITNANLTTIKASSDHDYINTSRSTTNLPDTFVNIPGASDGGLYEFPLEYWRKGEFPQGYPALSGMSTYGFRFWILLKGCGNIVYEKGTKKPDLEILKTRATGPDAAQGDTVNYTLQFRNNGGANAKDVSITDKLPSGLTYQSYSSNADLSFSKNGQTLSWRMKNTGSILGPSNRWFTINVTTKAGQISGNSQRVCNSASIDGSNTAMKAAPNGEAERCVTIKKQLCPGTGQPIPAGGVSKCSVNCPDGSTASYEKPCPAPKPNPTTKPAAPAAATPQLACQSIRVVNQPAWNSRQFETTVVSQDGVGVRQLAYYVNDKKIRTATMGGGLSSQLITYTFPDVGTYKVRAELSATKGDAQQSPDCTTSVTIEKSANPVVRISTDKGVANLTQNISNANNTTAKAGDVLRYTISVANSGETAATNFALSGEYGESIADILEYADLTDKGDAMFNSSTKILTWNPVTIQAGGKIEKTFTVKIKNPIPATPVSASNPLSFDNVMHNKYGRDVNVYLKKPVNKVVEQTVTTLPATGPGASTFIAFAVVIIVGYFFYRSRLLARELEIVHHEFSAGGL